MVERDGNGKVVIVVIVVIQPVLELTPVQVIQARPTGSQVSITVCQERKGKRGHDTTPLLRLLFHQRVSRSWGSCPSGRSGRSPIRPGGLPTRGICRGHGGCGVLCRPRWPWLGLSGPAERFHDGVWG